MAAEGAARAEAVPREVLRSIALVESAGRPWSVNVDGAGRSFARKQDAIDYVRLAAAQGARFIDVGCFQIDLFYHPGAFANLDEAFDPSANAHYAARFLASLRSGGADDWPGAVAHYHSRDPWLGGGYRDQVYAVLGGVRAGGWAHAGGAPAPRFGMRVFGPGEAGSSGAGLPVVFGP